MKANAVNRKTLEYYMELKYPITIHIAPEGGFVAEIEDLPGCLAQGETLEETYAEIEVARKLWLETTYEDAQDIPLPRDDRDYSGKFIVRVPKSLHRQLDVLADREGVSLNQYLVSELSRIVGKETDNKGKSPN
jgi:antitoxin HicB